MICRFSCLILLYIVRYVMLRLKSLNIWIRLWAGFWWKKTSILEFVPPVKRLICLVQNSLESRLKRKIILVIFPSRIGPVYPENCPNSAKTNFGMTFEKSTFPLMEDLYYILELSFHASRDTITLSEIAQRPSQLNLEKLAQNTMSLCYIGILKMCNSISCTNTYCKHLILQKTLGQK